MPISQPAARRKMSNIPLLPAEIESRPGMMPRATIDYWSRQSSLTVIKGEVVIRPLRYWRWKAVHPSLRYGNPVHLKGSGVICLPGPARLVPVLTVTEQIAALNRLGRYSDEIRVIDQKCQKARRDYETSVDTSKGPSKAARGRWERYSADLVAAWQRSIEYSDSMGIMRLPQPRGLQQ